MRAGDTTLAAEIGTRLRTARKAAGLSQIKATARTGMPQNQISAWERGLYLISIPNLLALADAYDASLLALLGREDATPGTEA